MKSLDEIKPRSNDFKWRDQVVWKDMPKSNTWYPFRLIGGIYSISQHWVKTTNKTGKEISFPVDCLAWDADNETADPDKLHACPGCQAGLKNSIKYLFNVIDRNAQKRGDSNYIKGFELPPTAMKKIVDLRQLNMANGDPYSVAHPEYGCDLFIQWSTESTKGFGDWNFQKGERTPLTKEELAAELYDFEEIYTPTDEMNARNSLIRAGLITVDQAKPLPGSQMPPAEHQQPTVYEHMMPSTPVSEFKASAAQQLPPTVKTEELPQVSSGLGKPPAATGLPEKPSCFGGFLGNLDCVSCPHKTACLAVTSENS